MSARDHDLAELVKTAGKKEWDGMKKLRKEWLDEKEIFSVHEIMIQRHFGGKRW